MSTWLITGCSTGLGRALADAVIGAGHNAVVTARDVAKVADLADTAPQRVLPAALDVTKPEQVASVVQQAQERFGSGINVLVNNAGYGYRAAVEEGDDAEVRTLFETHFFGTVRNDQGRPTRHAGTPQRRDREHLLDRRSADPGGVRLLLRSQSSHRRLEWVPSRRACASRHLGDGRRARRIPHRLRRALTRPVGHGH